MMKKLAGHFLAISLETLIGCFSSAAVAAVELPVRDGIANPERGFRFEIKIGLESGEPQPRYLASNWPFADYRKDGVTVAQAYCYLTKYCDTPIPQSKKDALLADFDRARRDGVKFLLRFAYESDKSRKSGPRYQQILAHIIELASLVRSNADVIYALQIGWVGAWGEFHSSASGIEFDKEATAGIVRRTLWMLPANRMTMMRTVQNLRNLEGFFKPEEIARIGLFNDATLANYFDAGTFMGDRSKLMRMAWDDILAQRFAYRGGADYEYLHELGPHVPVDGELFWNGNVDPIKETGLEAINRFRYHHYTTFSLVHSNSELDRCGKKGTEPGAIDRWKVTPITPELLSAYDIPCDRGYFAPSGMRTAYEYIRDHLGYRLAAGPCRIADGKARVVVRNHGFAAPINPRKAYFCVIGADGKVTEIPTAVDCRSFEPEKDSVVEAAVPALKDGERLALWLPDEEKSVRLRPEYAIQFADGAEVGTIGGYRLNVLRVR